MARYEHAGNAQDARLVGDLSNSGLGLTVDVATNWPTGSVNKFWVTVDPDTTNEEHILVNSRSGTSLTIAAIGDRGKEGTAAVAHTSGAIVRHIFSATEADDMAVQSGTNTFTAAQTFNATVGGTGGLALTNLNHYLGANAAGAAGSRLRVNTGTSPTSDVILLAEASGADSNFMVRPLGAGSIQLQTAGGVKVFETSSSSTIGFFAHTLSSQQTVTGSRAGNAALTSILIALANYGLIVNSSSA